MSYNESFCLDPKQLELIEDALRAEVSRLAPTLTCEKRAVAGKRAVVEINELLGHLHHQKFWFRPKEPVPMG